MELKKEENLIFLKLLEEEILSKNYPYFSKHPDALRSFAVNEMEEMLKMATFQVERDAVISRNKELYQKVIEYDYDEEQDQEWGSAPG